MVMELQLVRPNLAMWSEVMRYLAVHLGRGAVRYNGIDSMSCFYISFFGYIYIYIYRSDLGLGLWGQTK